MKKLACITLTLLLMLSAMPLTWAAAEGGEDNTLHIITRNIGSAIDSNNDIYREISKRTGLDITWELKPGENYAQLCQIIIASGDYPDAMEFIGATYPNDLQILADDKIIMPVDDLVAEYGQNIPQYRRDSDWFVSKTDGLRYGIPCRTMEYGLNNYFLIRQDWLDKLGIKTPETYQEFFDALSAMKDNSAQLVGEGQDFVPFGIFNGAQGDFFRWLASANGYVRDWNDVDGKLTYFVNMDGYKESLKMFRDLYQAGLVESEFPLMNRENFFEKFYANTYGSFCWYLDNSSPSLSAWMIQYKGLVPESELGVIYPFKDENGERRQVGGSGQNNIVIFEGTKNAANVVKLLNFLASDEGVNLVQMGIEGKDWEMVDGVAKMNALTESRKAELGFKSYYLVCMQGYITPKVAWESDLLDAFEPFKAIVKEPLVIATTPTYVEYGSSMNDIVNKYEIELIVGADLDFDAMFDQYVKEWNSVGGATWTAEMDEIYQANK